MKIVIIIGSVRDQRASGDVAKLVFEVAKKRGTHDYELIDLKDFNLPLLTSPVMPLAADKNYDDENVQQWSHAIDPCDAFVFVTPEYNHGVPGAFKNATDTLGAEFIGKPVTFVAHGSAGGVRAVEQWRQIVINFSMPQTRSEVNFGMFTDWTDGEFTPIERREGEINSALDELEDLLK